MHGNRGVDRVYVDPVHAPTTVRHERPEIAVVAVVAHVVHECGGLVRVGCIARHRSGVGEEVRAHLNLLRGGPRDFPVQEGAIAKDSDESNELL